MKGFIEISLMLLLALIAPRLIEIEKNLQAQLKNLALYKQDHQIESDLNYYLINQEISNYKIKYTLSEHDILENSEIKLKKVSAENKLSKIVVEAKNNRIFNWNKSSSISKKHSNCTYGYLELAGNNFFDCEKLEIDFLKTSTQSRIISTGVISVNYLEANDSELISYDELKIKHLKTSPASSLLLFSQVGEVKTEDKIDCNLLNLQISDKIKNTYCQKLELNQDFWPKFKILNTEAL